MDRPLLIVFIGFPGSGKTYFSERLAKKIGALRINSDALRVAMFGSLEAIETIRQSDDRSPIYEQTFGAMNYVTGQALSVGQSVVYDAQQSKRADRARIKKLATAHDAIPILVWIKTDPDIAVERVTSRPQRDDSDKYTEEKGRMLVERFSVTNELPTADENVIDISGHMDFAQQYADFQAGVARVILNTK